ncbi:MAG: NADH-quinone oxidoreductase subunit NuoN [Burkholderiales bacterium]|nr:NADH-quinone oxidoreductase subunit NuoN [Burkholderiales bacterium]
MQSIGFPVPDLAPAAPEIFLLTAACVILMVDLFLKDESRWVSYSLTLATLAGCAYLIGSGSGATVYTFSDMFVRDPMADVLKVFVCIAVAGILIYGRGYVGARGMYRGELFVLALFAALGMMVMISASHLLLLYLGLELLSLSLYSMVALQRDSRPAVEAAMKYFVLGALASGLLLYGMSMIYGATGTMQLGQIASAIAAADNPKVWVLGLGVAFIVAGVGFKLGVVPFHMWVPDVYHGAPTAITIFIGSAPKMAAFALLMRLLVSALEAMVSDWQQMLVLLSVLSLAIGNLTAIVQTNIKRMLAYSTISHMGFVLIGVLAGDLNGYGSAMFYVVAYVLMSLAAFGMVLLLSREGFEADMLDDFKGLNQRSPWYAFVMLLTMFSMAGLPPTIGFYAKLSVLQAVFAAGYAWLAVVAVVLSLIGAFYYLRIVKLMYFDAPQDMTPILPQPDMRLLLSANGLSILVLGILPQPLMALCIASIQYSL